MALADPPERQPTVLMWRRSARRLERQEKPDITVELKSVLFVHLADACLDETNDFSGIRSALPDRFQAKPLDRPLAFLRHLPLLQHP